MSNPNPFVPKGSLLEQQSKRRSNLKIGVSCVLAVGIIGLLAMLIQGCKRDTSADNSAPTSDQDTNPPVIATDTNNPPPIEDTNTPAMTAPVPAPLSPGQPGAAPAPTPAPIPAPLPVEAAPVDNGGSEYIVASGDTLGKIAKRNGVSLKALEAANPDVNPKHLKVKQKLVIPSGGTAPAGIAAASPDATGMDTGSDTTTTYTVKSGDTLHRIAKHFHTSVKAIESENNLSTTKIKVGQKLKIPAKAEAAPEAAPAPAEPVMQPALPTAPPAPVAPAAPAPGAPCVT